MRISALLVSFMLTASALTACGGGGGGGGGGTPSSMAGTWAASDTFSGLTYYYLLEISGSNDAFSGQLETEVQDYNNFLANFSGSRSGSTVEINFTAHGESFEGTLSGNRLVFEDFFSPVMTILDGPVTFIKR